MKCFWLTAVVSLVLLYVSETITVLQQYVFDQLALSPPGLNDDNTNCPIQPVPVDMPSVLPDVINQALSDLTVLGESSVDDKLVPGVVIGVTYKGKTLWSKGFGVKDKSDPKAVPPDTSTIFRIGSVSKIFPVIMLYQLYAKGSVQSLDDPLKKYAPDFKINNPSSRDGITLRQMASQLSGLPREAPCGNPIGLNVCPLTNEEILKNLSYQYVVTTPWTRPSYSNLAFALLGNLLTAHYNSDMTFEQYAHQYILEPLQLDNTGFEITDDVKSRMAVGYGPNSTVAPLIDLGYIAPAGQMYSTIDDLNKLSQFFYESHILDHHQLISNFNDILSSDMRREMSLPYFVNPDRQTGFGTPWEIMFRGNYTIRTKGGIIFGYSALFSFVPELQLGINALFSGSFDQFTFAEKAYDILLPALVSYLSEQEVVLPFPLNPDIYTGQYNSSGAYTANIVAKENKLFITLYLSQQPTVYYLSYESANLMQVYYPTNLLPCISTELSAVLGEWLYFDPPDSSGKSPGFSTPGIAGFSTPTVAVFSLYWKRVKS